MKADPEPKSFVVHSGTEILYADGMFLTLVGAQSRDHVVGTPLTEFVAPEFHAALSEQIERISAGDAAALGLHLSLRSATHQPRDVIALNSAVEWEGAEQVQTSFLNVSGEDPASGVTLRDYAMDEAPVGITMADVSRPDEPLSYANDGFVELTGYPREEVLGRNCRFLQGDRTRAEPVARLRAAIDAREPATVELRNYRKDGSMFWNRLNLVPIDSPDGAVTHYLGFQQDVTDTKLFEREKTLFEKQAEVVDQAMFITDSEGVIEYVNPAFERRTGYAAEEAIDRTPRILKSGQHSDVFYEELWETITSGEIWEAELTNETKAGELYEVKQTIVPITDDSGAITHFAAIEADITDRVLREQTVNVLNRVLRHNIRSAITVIDGQAEMLDPDREYTDPEAAIAAIRSQTASMEEIAAKTARIQRLWDREDPGTVWGRSTLERLVEGYRDQYPAAAISLTVDIDDSLRFPDAALFELAFDEAVENAVVHTDRDVPAVDVTAERLEGSDHGRITVADDGPGMPANERAAIEAGTELPLTHGTGIGLWIMEWVTTSLGGEFTIADNEPSGTVLEFQLPVVPDDDGSDTRV